MFIREFYPDKVTEIYRLTGYFCFFFSFIID